MTDLHDTGAPVTVEARRTGPTSRGPLGAVSPAQRLALVVIFGVALALRIAWCVHSARPPHIGDPVAYYFYGNQIAEGHGYHSFTIFLGRISEIAHGGPRVFPNHNVPTAVGDAAAHTREHTGATGQVATDCGVGNGKRSHR